MHEKQIRQVFDKEVTQKDFDEAYNRSEELNRKAEGGFLKSEIAKIKILISMIKDYYNGIYREIPWHTISAGIITMLYLLNPIDIIPDFIPLAGQADDLAVLYFFWRMAKEDIKIYAIWKASKDSSFLSLYKQAFDS